MLTRYKLLPLIALFTAVDYANAQVNLDKPISAGTADKVFLSSVDPSTAYYFPIGLVRTGEVEIKDRDAYSSTARFKIKYAGSDLQRVQNQIAAGPNSSLTVRFFRPLNYTIEAGIDLTPTMNPNIEVLNDLTFDGTTEIALVVDSYLPRRQRITSGLRFLSDIFHEGSADNIARIKYEYLAISEGQPGKMRTAVGLYVGERKLQTNFSYLNLSRSSEETLFAEPLIIDDSVTPCWNEVEPGVFCFRKNK